jgi:hypothetical protein
MIDKQSNGQYTVRANSSECGEERSTTISFPYSNSELIEHANVVFRTIQEMPQGGLYEKGELVEANLSEHLIMQPIKQPTLNSKRLFHIHTKSLS